MRTLLRALLRMALTLALFLLLPLLLFWGMEYANRPDVEDGSTLVIELSGSYVEAQEAPILARLLGQSPRTFAGLYSQLRMAERDERVASVLLRIRGLRVGWAKAQEIREAIEALGRAEKRTVAYLELASFGANLEYYVASAADAVHVAPAALAPIPGLAAEYLFLGQLWEELGIELEVERVGEYKTAADFLAGSEMTDAHREMANALLDAVDQQFVSGIAEGRGLEADFVRRAIDQAPASPEELVALGLADAISHYDGVLESLGDPPVIESDRYARVPASTVGFEPEKRVALVYGSGAVVVGRGRSTRSGEPVLASDTVVRALEKAAEDDSIDAILFRIDSPGGSALASDAVWRATQQAVDSGKPLVVSMSDLAASGGYYVACGADHIVASPGTLTGSIGVFLIRPALAGVYEKLSIGVEGLTRGARSDLLLSSSPLSPESRERLRHGTRSLYDRFVGRVADGRDLSPAQVDAVGRGRVWTGSQALEIGLVDELGGLRSAVAWLRGELGVAEDADLELVPFPEPQSLAEQLADLSLVLASAIALPTPWDELARRWEPWLAVAASGGPALLPPFPLDIR